MKSLNIIAVFNKDHTHVLMCYRRKEPYKGKYNFVGGKIKEGEESLSAAGQITKQDLMALGLSGSANSHTKRQALLKKLDLPAHMSANAMLQALNLLMDRDSLQRLLSVGEDT